MQHATKLYSRIYNSKVVRMYFVIHLIQCNRNQFNAFLSLPGNEYLLQLWFDVIQNCPFISGFHVSLVQVGLWLLVCDWFLVVGDLTVFGTVVWSCHSEWSHNCVNLFLLWTADTSEGGFADGTGNRKEGKSWSSWKPWEAEIGWASKRERVVGS